MLVEYANIVGELVLIYLRVGCKKDDTLVLNLSMCCIEKSPGANLKGEQEQVLRINFI